MHVVAAGLRLRASSCDPNERPSRDGSVFSRSSTTSYLVTEGTGQNSAFLVQRKTTHAPGGFRLPLRGLYLRNRAENGLKGMAKEIKEPDTFFRNRSETPRIYRAGAIFSAVSSAWSV